MLVEHEHIDEQFVSFERSLNSRGCGLPHIRALLVVSHMRYIRIKTYYAKKRRILET